MTSTSRTLSYDEGLAALQRLEERDKLTPFAVGDIVLGITAAGEGKSGPLLKQLAKDLGRSLAWVRTRRGVAAMFPPDVREELWGGQEPPPPVTWEHHRIVFDYCTDETLFHEWIRRAVDQELSSRQLKEAIRGLPPDADDDIIITHDPHEAELHIRLSEELATSFEELGPGVKQATDKDGQTTGMHVRLPESAKGRKVRVRHAR